MTTAAAPPRTAAPLSTRRDAFGAARVVAIMLTRRCDIACGHCSVVSGPDVRGPEPSLDELRAAVRAAAAAGAGAIQLTGGEPMLRRDVALELLREARRAGIASAITTNGSWGRTLDEARATLRELLDAGLGLLTISWDRWHEEQLGSAPAMNVVRAAHELAVLVHANVVRDGADTGVERLADALAAYPNVRLRFYDAQPVGRAKAFDRTAMRHEIGGFCRAAWFPAVTDDGRVTACNGPAYFAKPGSPLLMGSTREAPLHELFARHRDDPVVQAIRAYGPLRLREELERLPGFESFPFRATYGGMCELCLQITSDPGAVAALREHLAEPRRTAERAAVLRLISEARAGGQLDSAWANGVGAARVFLAAARNGGVLPRHAEQVLGRADLDWRRRADYLVACGLARPLVRLADDPEVTRFAPGFFRDAIRVAATRAAMNDLVKREALRLLDGVLGRVGVRGVLLKGTALLATTPAAEAGALRATGDVDVLVTGGAAREVRRRLLEAGCSGEPVAERSAEHHLAPVAFRGIAIELHERILPDAFGLPDDSLVARARRVEGAGALLALDDEGFVLHALLHCTAHAFAFGLKTGWDLAWVLDRRPDLDWSRVIAWAAATRLPRAFWTPLVALASELELPVPKDVLARATRDRRQRALETIARARLLTAREGPFELNPFSKTALFLLLADGWLDRARYVGALVHGDAAEARRSARGHASAQALREIPRQLREVAFQWRSFRRLSAGRR